MGSRVSVRPTQSIICVHCLIARFQEILQLFVQCKYTKICAEDQMLQDPNLCTRLCSTAFNTQPGWRFHFRPTKMIVRKCFVPLWYHLPKGALKGTLTGMALTYFYYTICSVWRIVDLSVSWYGVATISRLLQMIGLFCRISSLL